MASEETFYENIGGDSLHNHQNNKPLPQDMCEKQPICIDNELDYSNNKSALEAENVVRKIEPENEVFNIVDPLLHENNAESVEELSQHLVEEDSNNVEIAGDYVVLEESQIVAATNDKNDEISNSDNLIDFTEKAMPNLANNEIIGADDSPRDQQVLQYIALQNFVTNSQSFLDDRKIAYSNW